MSWAASSDTTGESIRAPPLVRSPRSRMDRRSLRQAADRILVEPGSGLAGRCSRPAPSTRLRGVSSAMRRPRSMRVEPVGEPVGLVHEGSRAPRHAVVPVSTRLQVLCRDSGSSPAGSLRTTGAGAFLSELRRRRCPPEEVRTAGRRQGAQTQAYEQLVRWGSSTGPRTRRGSPGRSAGPGSVCSCI